MTYRLDQLHQSPFAALVVPIEGGVAFDAVSVDRDLGRAGAGIPAVQVGGWCGSVAAVLSWCRASLAR